MWNSLCDDSIKLINANYRYFHKFGIELIGVSKQLSKYKYQSPLFADLTYIGNSSSGTASSNPSLSHG